MCKSTYFEHQLASHGGAFTSPEVEGVGITKNGIYIFILYIVIYDHCILIITSVNCTADLNQTYRSDPESDVELAGKELSSQGSSSECSTSDAENSEVRCRHLSMHSRMHCIYISRG